MTSITPRLSVEGPDENGWMRIWICGKCALVKQGTTEASALLQALQPSKPGFMRGAECAAEESAAFYEAKARAQAAPPSGSAPLNLKPSTHEVRCSCGPKVGGALTLNVCPVHGDQLEGSAPEWAITGNDPEYPSAPLHDHAARKGETCHICTGAAARKPAPAPAGDGALRAALDNALTITTASLETVREDVGFYRREMRRIQELLDAALSPAAVATPAPGDLGQIYAPIIAGIVGYTGHRPGSSGWFEGLCNRLRARLASVPSLPPAAVTTDTLRFGAATLAQEVLASKQNVGNYLKGLACNVLEICESAPVPSVPPAGEEDPRIAAKVRAVMEEIRACTPGARLADVPTLFAFGPIYRAIAEAESPAGGEARTAEAPVALNDWQKRAVKQWAADDRLWTTQETVEFNLTTFARTILAAASYSVPTPEAGARQS